MKHLYTLSLPENLLQRRQPKSLGSIVPACCRHHLHLPPKYLAENPSYLSLILSCRSLLIASQGKQVILEASVSEDHQEPRSLYSHIFSGSRFGMCTGYLKLAQQDFFPVCFNHTVRGSRTLCGHMSMCTCYCYLPCFVNLKAFLSTAAVLSCSHSRGIHGIARCSRGMVTWGRELG